MTRRVLSLLVLLALVGARAAAAAQAPHVSVGEENGVYRVRASFDVAATPAMVLSVLSDYGHISDFMPGVKRSEIREQQAGHAVVEQEAVSRLMLFSKRVHLLLDIHQDAAQLTFRDTCGTSFTVYNGSWAVVPVRDGTTITYELSAQPAFDVPEFVLRRLLKRDSADMIDALTREIATRSARAR